MNPQINTYQQLSVFIEALLLKLKEVKGKNEFTGNHAEVHRNFYNLKQKYPEYFNRLLFDENGHYPISEDLDSILQDFQVSGIINKLNPGFKTIMINNDDSLSERMQRKIPNVDEDSVQQMANELTI